MLRILVPGPHTPCLVSPVWPRQLQRPARGRDMARSLTVRARRPGETHVIMSAASTVQSQARSQAICERRNEAQC